MPSRPIVLKYYLATPVFMLIELLAGVNVRIAIPWGEDYFLYIYMAVCFVVGGLMLKKVVHLNLFALLESSINILLLIMSVFLPIFAMADSPELSKPFKFGVIEILHFALVGSTLLYVFYTNPIIKQETMR